MRNLKNKKNKITDDIKVEKFVIKHDDADKFLFNSLKKGNKRLEKTEEEITKFYPQFEELQQDLYDALYKYTPELLKENQVSRTHLLNRIIVDKLMGSDKYKELRSMTRLDAISSAMGTEILGNESKGMIEELQEEAQKLAEDAEKLEGMGGSGKGGTQKDEEGKTLQDAKQELEDKIEETQKAIEKRVEQRIGKLIDEAIKVAEETSELISNWGLGADETYTRSSYEDKLKLLEKMRNSERLRKLVDMVGRYKRLAVQAQKEKVKKGIDEVYDIRMGADLSRALPSELMKLSHPVTKKLFLKDFSEHKILQYEYSGKEKKYRGPIIVCLDSSGSMMGQAEIWSKAVALGVLEIARIQKRSMYVLHFDACRKEDIHINSFPKDKPNSIEEIIDMAEFFLCGGTLFEPPLERSRELIDQEGEFTKADIIFVTDGESAVRDKWLSNFMDWKKQKKVNIYSVLIDAGYNSSVTLKEFSDTIYKLSDLRRHAADDLATNLFTLL